MADADTLNLLKRLHFLRNRAPEEFKSVQEALNQWAGCKLSLITAMPPEQLVQFQGQMQAIESILTLLQDSAVKPPE